MQSLYHQYPSLWFGDIDNICQAGEETKQISSALPLPHSHNLIEIRSQTVRSSHTLALPLYTHSWDNPGYTGLDTSTGLKMAKIPKAILFSELSFSKRTIGHPQLCPKDVCKCDMGVLGNNHRQWKDFADDCGRWWCIFQHQLRNGEKIIGQAEERWRQRYRWEWSSTRQLDTHQCRHCDRTCQSLFGLISHTWCFLSHRTNLNQGSLSMVDPSPMQAHSYYRY